MAEPSEQDRSEFGKTFDQDGFVVIRGFISPAEAAEIRENIDRFVKDVLPGCPPNTALYEDKTNPASIKRLANM